MASIAGIRLKNPAHPGGFIKHEIIEPLLDLSQCLRTWPGDIFIPELDKHLREPANRPYGMHRIVLT